MTTSHTAAAASTAAAAAASTAAATAAKKAWLQVLPFFIFFILLFALTSTLPFFWDKDILYSKIAHWLPGNHFSLVLPVELDAGYPPALGYLLALAWELTGKSLFTAHLLMLPFTLGILWQTRNLLNHFMGGRFLVPAMILLFTDTVFLSQTVVFSTDLVMLFFMILALNSILRKKRYLLALAVTGLLFSHMRGIMVVATLCVLDVYLATDRKNFPVLFRLSLPYIPALAMFSAWMIHHYFHTGWVLYHPASPWAGCYERVSAAGMLRNSAIVLWRMADYGRLFVWIIPALAFFTIKRKKILADPNIRMLLLLLTATFLFTVPAMVTHKILNGHRYLIPFFFLLTLLASYLLFINPGFRHARKILFALVLAGLVSGSFWVYPEKTANGWDATLAHLPYHQLRHRMIRYIDQQKIPFENVGSETPNLAPLRYIDLINDDRSFPRADLRNQPYIFYSNIFNMFTDAEIDELHEKWIVEKEYECLQVVVRLYRKSNE
jgi:hypothetical protein